MGGSLRLRRFPLAVWAFSQSRLSTSNVIEIGAVREFFGDLFSSPSYQVHPMDPGQAFDAGELRALRDPFDALICAAARDLDLPLITRDGAITDSKLVRAVW